MRVIIPSLIVGALSGLAPTTRAESWCAYPLTVHEWGVHVFAADGQPSDPAHAAAALPAWFHTPSAPGASPTRGAVRDLPADSGIRALPVLHFYGSLGFSGTTIPVGLEVGFSQGAASAWYPGVDHLNPAEMANGPLAIITRARLMAERLARTNDLDARGSGTPSADPTRQLVWDRLELSADAAGQPQASDIEWVRRARALGALWLTSPTTSESERFAFYEAGTREVVALRVLRAPTWAADRRAYVIVNAGKHVVHDVLVTHHERGKTYVFEAPSIPAGKQVSFVLEDHLASDVKAQTIDRLRQLLIDAKAPEPSREQGWGDRCVMGRDPALPLEQASGYRLFTGEVELILAVWAKRFFDSGTTVLYREDIGALDEAMPLSIYTDMYHYVELTRMGLALWDKVVLP